MKPLLSPIVLFVCLLLAAPVAHPADLDKASTAEINILIKQLGDGDYAKREDAAKQLKAIGKPAVPALKDAADTSEDPEVVSRAQALIKRIEIRRVPGPNPARGAALTSRTRMTFNNGTRVIDVTDQGRTIKIVDAVDSITMTVNGFLDGQPATEEFAARDFDQLKADNPAAADLYEQCNRRMGQGTLLRGPLRINGGVVVFNGGIVGLPVPVAPPDELEQLRTHLDKQIIANKLKDDQRAQVLKGLDALVETRNAGPLTGMQKYSDQCDEFRKTLEQYKLDPGEFLPPPAKARLGITIIAQDNHVIVREVSDNSRAQRLGLKAGDIIRKADGKEITDVGGLRKAATDKEKGLILEVSRDGAVMKLEEKEEKK